MTAHSPYCCEGMRIFVHRAGEGIFVVARNPDDPRLCLDAMSRDRAFLAEVGLRFCLVCGRPTSELVHAHREFYVALAREHEKQFPGFGF